MFSYSKNLVRNLNSNSSGVKDEERPKQLTAIGTKSFKRLVLESNVFIDKSMLIKDFIEDPGEALLLTFPRRWGKSINMDMIKQFLRIEVDAATGDPLESENEDKRENQKLFIGGKIDFFIRLKRNRTKRTKILDKLKIADHQDIMDYQGQFPVIHVDFKDTTADSYENFLDLVKEALQYSFFEHEYLLKSSKIRESEKLLFTKYIDKPSELTYKEVIGGLKTLSRLLYKHFDKRSYILMDEYDSAINHSYIKFTDDESENVIGIFRGINKATFKSNDYLEKGLITGVLRIAKEDLFSSLNNLREFSMLDLEFYEHYGFTQHEVESLFSKHKVPETLAKDITRWYNGYTLKNIQIYNPFSIVKCLTKFEKYKNIEDDLLTLKIDILQNYWEKSGSVNFLGDLFKIPIIKNQIEKLVRGEPIKFNFKEEITSKDFKMMKKVMNLGSNYVIKDPVQDVLFSYLFHAGYLTAVSGGAVNGFILPNNEIKSEMQNKLLVYYSREYGMDMNLCNKATDQLQTIFDSKSEIQLEKATKSFEKAFTILLESFPAFRELLKNQSVLEKNEKKNINIDKMINVDESKESIIIVNENVIHTIMSHIELQLKSFVFGSELYLGNGRADIVIVDRVNRKAAVIELKYDHTADKAFQQIIETEYAKKLVNQINTILIGINVNLDKTVTAQSKEMPKGKNFSSSYGAYEGNT
jgi:hypothetical protein